MIINYKVNIYSSYRGRNIFPDVSYHLIVSFLPASNVCVSKYLHSRAFESNEFVLDTTE